MTRYKKPKSKKKPVTMTQAELKKLSKELSDEAVTRALTLFLAYMMEEQDFDLERLCDCVDGINRWAEAVDDHLITINQVAKIIEEHTGVELIW